MGSGLAVEKQADIKHILRSALEEFDLTLYLYGIKGVAELDKSWIRKIG